MEFRDKQAIYLQIADIICENILREKWAEQEKIPSVRQIAVELEVNPNTAMRTYAHLQDLGIISNKRGIGYFVSKKGVDITKKHMKQQFINHELPRFFNSLELLDISLEELNKLKP